MRMRYVYLCTGVYMCTCVHVYIPVIILVFMCILCIQYYTTYVRMYSVYMYDIIRMYLYMCMICPCVRTVDVCIQCVCECV